MVLLLFTSAGFGAVSLLSKDASRSRTFSRLNNWTLLAFAVVVIGASWISEAIA